MDRISVFLSDWQVLFREGWLEVTGKVQRRGPKALSIIAEDLAPLNCNKKHSPESHITLTYHY